MTLQSSGAISLANVQTEFGGSNPIGINEYYGSGGAPASGTISLNDFYGRSSFDFTANIFGSSNSYSIVTTSNTYSGNIVTPGSGSSPKTFRVIQVPFSPGGYCSLSYYQGGSLNTTWAGYSTIDTTHTFTFGSSSMQFISYVVDEDTDNYSLSYNQIYWGTSQGAPSARSLFYHEHNRGPTGYSD